MTASTSTRNVILVGEAGSGKTSIINMIAGNNVAPISEATGTRSCTAYPIPIGKLVYNVYDTPGLDAPGLGTEPVTELINDMQDGVNLLVFCMRGRITEDAVAIYRYFSRSLLVKVPVIVVITGLEQEDPMQSWWTKNHAAFKGYGMSFADYACVTTLRGKGSIFAVQYEESMNTVRDKIATCCLPNGQRVESHRRQGTPALTSSPITTHIPIKQQRRRLYIITLTAVVVVIVIVVAVVVSHKHGGN